MIDMRTNGWVTAPLLYECMHSFGQYCHKDDTNTFVRRFDRDSDGRLLYSDFCDAFTPRDPYFAGLLNNRHSAFLHRDVSKFNYFLTDTREKFFRCFKVHFEIEESIELIKKRLARRPKFNYHDAFKYIDELDTGYLCREDFKRVLNKNQSYPSETELNLIADRFDKKANGRISYNEFIEEIMPKNTFAAR